MNKQDPGFGLLIAIALIWVFGFAAGWSIGIKRQPDISITETDHSVETDHHAHQ